MSALTNHPIWEQRKREAARRDMVSSPLDNVRVSTTQAPLIDGPGSLSEGECFFCTLAIDFSTLSTLVLCGRVPYFTWCRARLVCPKVSGQCPVGD